MKETGKLIISLDLELMWGVRDAVSIETYGENIKGVHTALPRILELFSKFKIKGTFAAVGFLFFKDKEEMMMGLPEIYPQYQDANISPYGTYIEKQVGTSYEDDPYHFGLHLIKSIQETPGQEIGTHTFSHYYSLEPGQSITEFEQDLKSAISIAEKRGIHLTSIIFPRNQVNTNYLKVCEQMGIMTYRSNEESWIYKARNAKEETLVRRIFRLLDAYVNISGHHGYSDEYMAGQGMVNIPSSRFLRPYSKRLSGLESLRLKRIKDSMTYAAKNNLTYHLWWHPHNFGINQKQNFAFLTSILQHYTMLNERYGFASICMSELANELQQRKFRQLEKPHQQDILHS